MGLTDQAKIAGFSPKVYFVGVGTAFPLFKQKFGAGAEGVMGIGGSNADLPSLKKYIEHHKSVVGASRTLGEPGDLCEPSGAAAGDREGWSRQGEGH
jgi:hypothetical protein